MFSLYVHYPFCLRVCPYCDFTVFKVRKDSETWNERYLRALLTELKLRKSDFQIWPCKTVYFGGGTPSLAPPVFFENILDNLNANFDMSMLEEVTLEADPLTADKGKLFAFRSLGVTRLSIGVQSLNQETLQVLDRRVSPDDITAFLDMASEAGFEHVSVDLMYGVPGQTLAEFVKGLEFMARDSRIDHLSLYALTVEPAGRFEKHMDRLGLSMPKDLVIRAQYEKVCEILPQFGFKHYELSSFARIGGESNHNQGYWRQRPYLGLGLSAHSLFVNDPSYQRRENTKNLKTYIDNSLAGAQTEILTEAEKNLEYFMLRLRKTSGFNLDDMLQNVSDADRYLAVVERLLRQGSLVKEGRNLRLAPHTYFVSNEIFSEFCI